MKNKVLELIVSGALAGVGLLGCNRTEQTAINVFNTAQAEEPPKKMALSEKSFEEIVSSYVDSDLRYDFSFRKFMQKEYVRGDGEGIVLQRWYNENPSKNCRVINDVANSYEESGALSQAFFLYDMIRDLPSMKRIAKNLFTSGSHICNFVVERTDLELTPELWALRGNSLVGISESKKYDCYSDLLEALSCYEKSDDVSKSTGMESVAKKAEENEYFELAAKIYSTTTGTLSEEWYRNVQSAFILYYGDENKLDDTLKNMGVTDRNQIPSTKFWQMRADYQFTHGRYTAALNAYLRAENEEGVQKAVKALIDKRKE